MEQWKHVYLPAPIVSPFRRSKMRPMSLLAENVSSGIDTVFVVEGAPNDDVPDRSWISTRADEFLVNTRGLLLITAPLARSIVSMSLLIVAGVSRDWWNSST